MEYKLAAEQLKASYRSHWTRYRQDDEIEVTTEPQQRLRRILEQISRLFGRPITVLDLGCGTGRYFYCLKNVDRLVGVDLSREMLEAAAHPVREGEVSVKQIELQCANVFELTFPDESFDFIYSLGMFGFGCPVTLELCNRFYTWLKPGGRLFFDTLDRAGLRWPVRVRRRLRRCVYPALPRRFQQTIDEREGGPPMYDYSARELKALMRASRFKQFAITSSAYKSPIWQRVKLECLAVK